MINSLPIRNLHLILLGLMFTACSAPTDNPPPAEVIVEETHELTDGFYTGELGIYDAWVGLDLHVTGGKITGTYIYAKYGEPLLLEGQWDPETDRWVMTETWEGKVTGHFSFEYQDDQLRGFWKSSSEADKVEEFVFVRVEDHPEVENQIQNSISEIYSWEHESWVYANNEQGEIYEKKFTTKSWIRVTSVGQDHLLFFYRVWSSNGHRGTAEGMATRVADGFAAYEQSFGYIPDTGPCRLTFEFTGDQVEVTVINDCGHMGGARIGLPGGTYTRETDAPAVN